MAERFCVPAHVRDYIKDEGYPFPAGEMDDYLEAWWQVLHADGDFWDWDEIFNGVHHRVHRRSIHPAKRVTKEWGTLLMDEETRVVCDNEACTEWLDSYYDRIGFFTKGQRVVQSAFALGTAAWALWLDTDKANMQVRRYFGSAVLPLSWDDDGVSECAFCSRASYRGQLVDQLQMHLSRPEGYAIKTVLFDAKDGKQIHIDGVIDELATGCMTPTFALVSPAVENTRVELSPYGESIFADAIDIMQSVDLCYDALMNEVELAKMRVFISDVLIDYRTDKEGNKQAIPFGRDNVVFRKVVSNEDTIEVVAPSMRTQAQIEAYRLALQAMGDACGFGLQYFDLDKTGGIRTATEVSSDNSQLMRSIAAHEHALELAINQITRAVIHCANTFLGERLPDYKDVRVMFDDSIIQDTQAEKNQDMAEVSQGIMSEWEYRVKWYGEDEATAKANVPRQGIDAPEELLE